MIAASVPIQRPAGAKLLVVDGEGEIAHYSRNEFVNLLRDGDLLIANDAATVPASLFGVHIATGRPIEVRLAGQRSLDGTDMCFFNAVVFGEGDYHTPTERRSNPPVMHPGDKLQLGSLRAQVVQVLGHPRLICLEFEGSTPQIWEGLARHGRPIQYAHVPEPLAIWDTWTAISGPPVAFEAPSAGFMLDWNALNAIRVRGAQFATITHAAGISSTGSPELDQRLPLDEPYRIPPRTAGLTKECRGREGRVIAIGTTVVRALEHAARADGSVLSGTGIATQKIGPGTHLRVVDAIVSGTHEAGTSHHELLRAFVDDETLRRMDDELEAQGYRTHEFGDSVFINRQKSVDGRQ